MNTLASFERFDYLLRANKHIERRLVFDLLLRADARVSLRGHSYLGFGSMWYGDFRPAHRLLGIKRMISMERSEHAPRATFNRPYACITVAPGDCSAILEGFGAADWEQPFVAWLDYDGRLDENIARDIALFVERCAPDSALFVTVNAVRNSYRTRTADPKNRAHTSAAAIEHFLGPGVLPSKYDPQPSEVGTFKDIEPEAFPQCLASSLLTYLSHKVSSAGRHTAERPAFFEPLISIGHKDGADMITVGGAITSKDHQAHWKAISVIGTEGHQELDFVPLTIKEKLALDECLPHIGEDFLARARSVGLQLSDGQLERYRRYYRHFPVFVESPI